MKRIVILLLVLILSGTAVRAQSQLTDPYEILQKHIDAIGGMEEVMSQMASYVEATITV